MTLDERLQNLEKIERELRKIQKKGMKLLIELETEDSFKGYGEEYARRDFCSFVEWTEKSISTKRKWALKSGE